MTVLGNPSFLNLIESSENKLAELKAEKERLIRAYTAGILSLDEIAIQKTELDKQLDETNRAIVELRSELEPRLLSQQEAVGVGVPTMTIMACAINPAV